VMHCHDDAGHATAAGSSVVVMTTAGAPCTCMGAVDTDSTGSSVFARRFSSPARTVHHITAGHYDSNTAAMPG